MISILFNDEVKIIMKKKTTNRGNRQIHSSDNILSIDKIPLNGNIKIFKKDKQLYELNYNIHEQETKETESKWFQLNQSNDQFVVQIKASFDNNNLILSKVAIQELAGIKDVLLNI